MRWYALKVDYEMAGKDLIESVKLSGAIVRALGGSPPEGFNYELFLDEKGQKISKSKGNGLTIEEWLTYASPEVSRCSCIRTNRRQAALFRRDPRTVDDYLTFLDAYPRQEAKERLGNPVWHIHTGARAAGNLRGAATNRRDHFGMLLNLAAVANSEDPQVLWGFCAATRQMFHPRRIRALTSLSLMLCAISRFRLPRKLSRADEIERES